MRALSLGVTGWPCLFCVNISVVSFVSNVDRARRHTQSHSNVYELQSILLWCVMSLLEDSLQSCGAYSHVRRTDYPESQGEITSQSPIHLLFSHPHSLAGAICHCEGSSHSHRSDLPLVLLCSSPTFCAPPLSSGTQGH